MLSHNHFEFALTCLAGKNKRARIKLIDEYDAIRLEGGGRAIAWEWITSKADSKFVGEHLASIPFSLHKSVLWRHNQNKAKGYEFANEWLRETVESIQKPKLIEKLNIDARDDDIREHSKYLARFYKSFIKYPEKAIAIAEKTLGTAIYGDSIASKVNRICDEKFWRKRVRALLRVHREACHLRIAPEKLKHCSVDARHEYKSMLDNHAKWAAKYEFINQAGERFPAPSPADTAKNRYAQLVTQTQGVANIAVEKCMKPKIITITLDSRYHAAMDVGADKKNKNRIRNPKYENISPKQGHTWLNKQWTKFRSALKTDVKEIDTHWVVGIHAHKDMTPHWHIVMWAAPENWEAIEALIQLYFRTNNTPSQIQIEEPKSEGGAVGYCMKILQYITRQVGKADGEDNDDSQEAFDTSSWASSYGIRRYRTSDCATTLWKLSRKTDVEAPAEMKECAATGDYAGFLKAVKKHDAKIVYIKKMNQYGDTYLSPKGMSYQSGHETKSATSLAVWTIQPIGLPEKNLENYTYSKAPRTSKAESTAEPKNQDSLRMKYHSLQNNLIESEETEINGLADSVKNELRAVLG